MGFGVRRATALLIAAILAAPAWVGAQKSPATADAPPVAPATTLRAFKSDLRSVPALAGVPVGRVDALLEDARLSRGATRYETRAGTSAGVVIGQSPAAGTLVKIGSAVDVVISVAPPTPDRTTRDRSTTQSGADPTAALFELLRQGASKAVPAERPPEPAPDRTAPGSRTAPQPEPLPEKRPAPPEPRPPPPEPRPPPPEPRPPPPEPSVAVPDLVGRTLASQAASLRKLRLGVDSLTERYSAEPPGVVLAQKPAAGTQVKPGSMIGVVTSRGPPPRVVVPDVVGVDEAVAHARLAERKLPFEARESASTQADGVVLAQTPAAGTEVAPGTTVQLRVSDGSLVEVPALVGESAETAADAIARAGLRGAPETRESPAPPGQVIAQDPRAGSPARRGSTVRYWSAVAQRVPVPDLAGLTLDDAVARLGTMLRAVPRLVDSKRVAEGRIAGQDPPPQTLVEVGSAVHVEVSRGPPPLADLQGLSPEQARDAAAETGSQLGPPQREFDAAPAGQVIGQSPPPGTRLPPGSTVTIIVSRGPLWPWLAGGAAALALVLAGAAAALWTPVRYRVRFEPVASRTLSAAAVQVDGPALALRARLERGAPTWVQTAEGDPR